MSWSFTVSPVPPEEFDDAIDAARAVAQANVDASNSDGSDQADQAVKAAKALVGSGVVGGKGVKIGAVLSGHGNPEHTPRDGYANDTVSVNVYQAS